MAILVIADHDNAHLKSGVANTIAAAQKCGGNIHVLVAGSGCAGAASAAAAVPGVAKVLVADAAHYADGLAKNLAPLVFGLANSYSHVMSNASAFGKNREQEMTRQPLGPLQGWGEALPGIVR